jgi:formylglycine-generating enzyme required for sulfatase activity
VRKRSPVALALVLPSAFAFVASCTDLGSLTGGVRDASDDGSPDAATGDDGATNDADDDGDAAFAGDCGGEAGPVPVRVGTYCIDSTEVTTTQYQAFLAAIGSSDPTQPTECDWNTSFIPTYQWPPLPGQGNLPVGGVDWCDARAYCAWAGKRLCGRIGGGTLQFVDGNNPARDEWYRVCSGNGTRLYPYGAAYDASVCNGTSNVREDVGSRPACAPTEFPGVVDLSGNVFEWEDLCTPGGDDAGCRVRGGSSNDSPAVLACDSTFTPERARSVAPFGIRCCSD